MARRKTKTLTELELEIMQIVWKEGEVVVGDIRKATHEAGRPLARPTIRTMLTILQKKGYLKRRPEGRAYAYQARVSQDEAQTSIVRDVVERAFEGSALGLVASLLGGRMVPAKELARVKRLIAQYEKEAKHERPLLA
jgi:predicted transcriptional regulator